MKTDTEISHLWQLAHLKFHFGEKLAMHAMHEVAGGEIATPVIRCVENQPRIAGIPAALGKSPGASVQTRAERSIKPGAEGKDSPGQTRKENANPQAPDLSTRIA